MGCLIARLECATREVETAELDGHTSTYSNKGCECAFVEGKSAFVFVDLRCTIKGAGVLSCCLESHFDDVERLACSMSVVAQYGLFV